MSYTPDDVGRCFKTMFEDVSGTPESNLFSKYVFIGPDGIPDEFFATFARQLVRGHGRLYHKAILRFDTPIQFAGSMLHELSNGAGLADIIDNWRSIFYSNSFGERSRM